jgi:hypothetical protein
MAFKKSAKLNFELNQGMRPGVVKIVCAKSGIDKIKKIQLTPAPKNSACKHVLANNVVLKTPKNSVYDISGDRADFDVKGTLKGALKAALKRKAKL